MKNLKKNLKKKKPNAAFFSKMKAYEINEYRFFSSPLFIKKHFYKNKDVNSKFNNIFIKNGHRLKGLNIVSQSLKNFYSLFFEKNNNISFKKYQDFLIFSKSDNNFFKKLFLVTRLVDLLSSPFFLKIEKISKKLKKLKKNSNLKYKYKISYVPLHRRTNHVTKQFLIYVNTLKYFAVSTRLTEALYNLILEDKKSDLYKQKINIIKIFKK